MHEFNPWEMVWNEPQKDYINSVQKEVFFSGGNQIGKSAASCALLCFHLTGNYPDWYTGRRFIDLPPRCMLIGETFTTARDLLVRKIIGTEHEEGAVGKDMVFNIEKLPRQGVGAFDVAHPSKGLSHVIVASYASGRRRVQGHSLDLVVIDEEPPMDVYDELCARTNATGGIVRISATPLSGYTELFTSYETDKTESKEIIYYKVEDAMHMTEEMRSGLISKYKEHPQGEARLNGKPCLWEGAVFNVPQHEVIWTGEEPDEGGCRWLIGIDIPHTTGTFAAVLLRHYTVSDVVIVEDEIKQAGVTVDTMAEMIRHLGGAAIPVAWPHDARIRKAEGVLVELLKQKGCNMLPEPAYMLDSRGRKNRSTVAIAAISATREKEGKLLYSAKCGRILRERGQYQMLDGVAAKRLDDHLLDGMFKGIMSLRFAKEKSSSGENNEMPLQGLRQFLSQDFFGG
jgi:phage terminase large subunit-like protein